MTDLQGPQTPRPFRLVWDDRVVGEFESGTGLDPWGRLLQDIKDKVVGDAQEALRAAVAPGLPYRQGGGQHKVRFERGEILDPRFLAWASQSAEGVDEASASDEPAHVRVEVLDPAGTVLQGYSLHRCAPATLVGTTAAEGRFPVTVLELGCDGWGWDSPDGSLPGPGVPGIGRSSLGRWCWKGVAVGAVAGAILMAVPLIPRLRDRTVPPTTVVAVGRPSPPPASTVPNPPAPGHAPGAASPIGDGGTPSHAPAPSQSGPAKPLESPPPSILPPDDPPVAVDDAYSTPYATALSVGPPGVLSNDSDPEGDAMTSVLVSAPPEGTLTLNPDGSFTYEPPRVVNGGTYTFTYRVVAGNKTSNVGTVTITMEPG